MNILLITIAPNSKTHELIIISISHRAVENKQHRTNKFCTTKKRDVKEIVSDIETAKS